MPECVKGTFREDGERYGLDEADTIESATGRVTLRTVSCPSPLLFVLPTPAASGPPGGQKLCSDCQPTMTLPHNSEAGRGV